MMTDESIKMLVQAVNSKRLLDQLAAKRERLMEEMSSNTDASQQPVYVARIQSLFDISECIMSTYTKGGAA